MLIIITMTTIVSSFICDVNNQKSLSKYILCGQLLLKANINKVIYIDEKIADQFSKFNNHNTKIIPLDRYTLYLYDYMNKLPNFYLNTNTPNKDTLEYMFVMCSKTEIIRYAIESNHFNSNQFIWIDFGINHIFKCSEEDFIQKIENLNNKNYDKVRISSIWDLNHSTNINLHNTIAWYFAGGVFGGGVKALIEFANLTKENCINIMLVHKTLMWEVNIWYYIYLNNKDLFNCYHSDHNATIIDHY